MSNRGVPIMCMHICYVYWNIRYKEINHNVFQFCSCITFQFSAFPWWFLCCLNTTGKMWRVIVAVILEKKSRGLGSDSLLKLREVIWPIDKIKDSKCKRETEPRELVNMACSLLVFGQCVMNLQHVVRYGWFTAKARVSGGCALLL